ncbi:hypothetical protein [Candidatus Frankia alpina]|uniref:hypothetical protein n=1 Tax=Candidatus Frankia alpina TaxID=2699483 RepID=UPI0013867418|nr:hypothetical protein [Candidatus Frankia alpina]
MIAADAVDDGLTGRNGTRGEGTGDGGTAPHPAHGAAGSGRGDPPRRIPERSLAPGAGGPRRATACRSNSRRGRRSAEPARRVRASRGAGAETGEIAGSTGSRRASRRPAAARASAPRRAHQNISAAARAWASSIASAAATAEADPEPAPELELELELELSMVRPAKVAVTRGRCVA